jgi:hypothetical protein
MKESLTVFSALAVFLICACGASTEDTTEVLDPTDDVGVPDPAAVLESTTESQGEEPAALDTTTIRKATLLLLCPNNACFKVSSSDLTGQCCICNGATRHYVRSAWSLTTFLCL